MNDDTVKREEDLKEAQSPADPVERLVSIIHAEIAKYESLIQRGKGTWPQNDYVRDSVWDAWNAKVSVLRSILDKFGI